MTAARSSRRAWSAETLPRGAAMVAAAVVALAVLTAARPAPLRGVNLAGMEFGADALPGTLGIDYVAPTEAELVAARRAGLTAIRLPVLWERLQPTLNAPLDPDALRLLRGIVAAAETQHLRLIVDIHNYGMWRGGRIGSGAVPVAAFAALWKRLGVAFRADPGVVFGLMNEPHDIAADAWARAAQAAVTAIRASGARNLVLVAGTGWDGAHNFVSGAGYGAANAPALAALRDPAGNLGFEVHQYLDSDFSGSHADCLPPDQAAAQIAAVTAWLRAGGRRGFLGETGATAAPACLRSLAALLGAVNAAPDAWLGWTYWAGGPWWHGYDFSIEPVNGREAAQMTVLRRLAASGAPPGGRAQSGGAPGGGAPGGGAPGGGSPGR